MAAIGAIGHVSYIVPISTNSEQNAGILWNGAPTAADDWTADFLGHNLASWSANGWSSLKFRVLDTNASRSFLIEMNRGGVYPAGEFNSGQKIGVVDTNSRQTVPATNATFGLRLVHRGGVSGNIEAWYDPNGTGTAWTLLDTISMADFSPSMDSTSTFSFFIASDCYYGPIIEGDVWVDNFRITNSVIGSIVPQTGLIKAVRPTFSNLMVGTNYQLQVSGDLNTWTNQGSAFTATNFNMAYPQYWDVDNWEKLFFRVQVAP